MNLLSSAVKKHSQMMKEAHDYIWTHPETGYREKLTSEYLEKAFESLGYELIKAGNIPGFYTIIDTGRPGPEVLILGELDSLICKDHPDADPVTGAVHCCGHSMQTATLLGIAAALKEPGILDEWSGRIRLCAVPAEETIELDYRTGLKEQGIIKHMGGKAEFLYRGYFDGVDIAFMIHSTSGKSASVNLGSVGFVSKRIIYKGISSHAGAPWGGCNALYAANLGLSAINSIRETFKESDLIRVHPIITEGGNAVNAIPNRVVLESFVRGKTMEAIVKANKRVNRALCGAALSIGANIEIIDMPGCAPLINDEGLIETMEEALRELPDIAFKKNCVISPGSTDMGDLSVLMPVIHPNMPGASGKGHGSDYRIDNPEKACTDSAIVQLHMLDLLLKNNAERAKRIVENYEPQFASKEEYFNCFEELEDSGERITYNEEGNVSIRL